ncbi:MAG: transposase [Candidatus Nitrosopolaris sp.]
MLQSLMLRLETSEEDNIRLLETVRKYNEACNFIAQKAFSLKITNKYKLHKIAYREIRERFNLSAQFAVRIIAKVAEAYRKKSIEPIFRRLGAIQYDQRNSRISIDRVSIMTLQGRLKLVTRIGDYQRQRWDRGEIKGQSDLIYKKGVFYLIVVQDIPEGKEYYPVDVLGIDLGIKNIAVDSDKEIFESKRIENTRQKYFRLRKILQHIGTKSAKRKLRKISGKERRFKKDTNHCLSKYIISKVKSTARAIGIEDLKYIRRSRVIVKSQRDRHSKWMFGELRNFLTYKAKREGVPLKVINPENTSRECPKCQYIDARNRKKNQFECLRCGYIEMADYVAAVNIAARAAVKQPIVADSSSYKPAFLIGGS